MICGPNLPVPLDEYLGFEFDFVIVSLEFAFLGDTILAPKDTNKEMCGLGDIFASSLGTSS